MSAAKKVKKTTMTDQAIVESVWAKFPEIPLTPTETAVMAAMQDHLCDLATPLAHALSEYGARYDLYRFADDRNWQDDKEDETWTRADELSERMHKKVIDPEMRDFLYSVITSTAVALFGRPRKAAMKKAA